MPDSKSFWDHPIAKLEEALSIRKQIAALHNKVNALLGNEVSSAAGKLVKAVKKRTRTMSAEARERIAAAQRARWAKTKGTSSAAPKAASSSARKKRTMSAEARERITAAQRARWAKSKGTAATPAKAPAPASKKKKKGGLSPEGRAKIVAALKKRWN